MFTSPDEDPAPGVVAAPLSAPPTAEAACCSPTLGTYIFCPSATLDARLSPVTSASGVNPPAASIAWDTRAPSLSRYTPGLTTAPSTSTYTSAAEELLAEDSSASSGEASPAARTSEALALSLRSNDTPLERLLKPAIAKPLAAAMTTRIATTTALWASSFSAQRSIRLTRSCCSRCAIAKPPNTIVSGKRSRTNRMDKPVLTDKPNTDQNLAGTCPFIQAHVSE